MTTSSVPTWNLNDPQPGLLIADLTHMGLLKITGEQGRSFIHGQVTTDITSLQSNQWRWGAHCDPKGKILASFRTFAIDDALLLMMPRDTLSADLPQLAKYAVFSKADLVDATPDWRILGIAGEQASQWISEHFGELTDEVATIPGGVLLQDYVQSHAKENVKESGRFILILDRSAADTLLSAIDAPISDHTLWQAQDILAGYPNIAPKYQGKFVPQMCNLQGINGISFNKGCYMGQETIARMKYRGGNKRALYILAGTSSMPIDLDTYLEIADEEGYRKVGSIIELVQTGNQVLMTVVLPNDTPESATLRVLGDEQSSLTIQPLPYSLED